jgi:hypothetical protein
MKKQLDEVKRLQKIAGIKEADYGFNKPFHDPYSQLTGTGKPTSDSPMLRAAAEEILDNLAVTSTEEELAMMTAEEAVAAAEQAGYEGPQATQIARLILRMVGSGM